MGPGFVWFRDRLGGFRSGVLMWSRQNGEKHRAGIRFLPLTHGEEKFIREQVARPRNNQPLQDPEAVIATITESFSRTCGVPKDPDPVIAPARAADPETASGDGIIGQFRSMISNR